ncbi:putative toxin-antitoxin system toxin component, PIN family [Candidatus Woesearchaeota archaeon]|nr:putative toxin-antitoxin system toxin component, PIN family [Candidatus Woesearchaeota archaeon]
MNKPIVVLDTNIFISAVFWEGKPYKIVKKAINQEIIVFISQDIIEEIKKVLARDFMLEKQEIDNIVDAVAYFTRFIEPKEKVKVVKEDPDDDRIIECALACGAEFIATQNKHLLKLNKFRNIKIVSPEEFLENCF